MELGGEGAAVQVALPSPRSAKTGAGDQSVPRACVDSPDDVFDTFEEEPDDLADLLRGGDEGVGGFGDEPDDLDAHLSQDDLSNTF